MELLIGQGRRSQFLDLEESWPLDARMALFLLESAGETTNGTFADRTLDRFGCRVRARLVRICDGRPESFEIFVRDLSVGHVGFVSQKPLDVGGEYQLHFTPADASLQIPCVVGRSREFTDGWREGVLYLHTAQAAAESIAEPPLRLAV